MSLTDIDRFMNLRAYISRPSGVNSSGDPTGYSAPEPIWCSYADAVFRSRRFHGDEIDPSSELITRAEIKQYDKIWPPGDDPEEVQGQIPDHIYREHDHKTGSVDFYMVRL